MISYLGSILQQNQLLRAQLQSDRTTRDTIEAAAAEPTHNQERAASTGPSRNPVLEDNPWFVPVDSYQVPLRVGESADTAFATRVRQLMSATATLPPRLSYPTQDQITVSSNVEEPRPSATQARFLIQTALAGIDQCCHIVRRSSMWALLDRFVENPTSLDLFSKCKFFSLLALGELYSSRCEVLASHVPGLVYFSLAFRSHGHLLERPSIDSIEVSLLLCLYSLCINRWHSAYFLASSATRHCAVMGLNFDIPETHLHDGAAREHLKRVWWTSYLLDHTCAAINGQMVAIQDDDISVSFPSNDGLSQTELSDFGNPHYISARVDLVRILRNIIKSLYGRANQNEPFLHRVQNALKGLRQWLQSLPEPLRMNQAVAGDSRDVRSLHLFFNQCMIMTSRPLLLHVIQHQKERNQSSGHDTPTRVPENIQAIVTSCIRCARHSHMILAESWIDGSFKSFDYFYTRYLFSTALVLGVSSLLGGPENERDLEDFKLCDQLLNKLKGSGSLPAMEFYQHLEALKASLATFASTTLNSDDDTTLGTPQAATAPAAPAEPAHSHIMCPMTADMALSEPCLEAFLLQSEPGLDPADLLDLSQLEGLYWPTSDAL
ncbi:hypothetical protein BHE90_001286 [Fusarium euwallaceae]|uniref:Xylanolytic transcriptional activator regulatory domain-containing protein n=2 Tax=Fusarium solani species complex TaxID=232080 RepID=A0A3M2SLI9_9HYPO|nr:hypothetical protein CDV36_001893 [Fusarium kuroshium]RTE84156.1 hypothetical protein BHE90_001286 [Fusarium euwallaceae]